MYINVDFAMVVEEFKKAGRDNQFSLKGLELIYNELVQIEEATGHRIEFDVVSLCCDWSETTKENCFCDTGYTVGELEEYTTVLQKDDVIVYFNF